MYYDFYKSNKEEIIMYLVKKVFTDQQGNVTITNGIAAIESSSRKLELTGSFWGKEEIEIGEKCDFEMMKGKVEHHLQVSYVNGYEKGHIYNKIKFYINEYEPKNVEGYIIFIPHEENIKTNGEILFQKWPTEIVVVLKEKDYLEFADKKLIVLNDMLWLQVDEWPVGKNLHDYRYTASDRIESLRRADYIPSSLANPDAYARVPLDGMPNPTGKVYKG